VAESADQRFKRLLQLVPYVLERPGVEVDEVCERFDISRTLLIADLNLLFVCGLPGYGPGDLIEAYIDGGRVIIRTAEYFKRPPRLTAEEGLLLYAGARALEAAGVANDALDRAMKRLEEALGPEVLERVRIGVDNAGDLGRLRQALETHRRVHLKYYAHSKDEVTERDVDPWALFVSAGFWYLVGWCHRVNDERVFRVDRILESKVLEEVVEAPSDLDLTKYESLYVQGPGAVPVVLDVSPDVASWVAEYYPLDSQEPQKDGWIRLRLTAGGMAWLERLLLRLGAQARVVEPASLKAAVKDLACRVLKRYEEPTAGTARA
jgi:proteasome accessory factor C